MRDRQLVILVLAAALAIATACSTATPRDPDTRHLLAECTALQQLTVDPSVTPPVPKSQPNPTPPTGSGSGFACVAATIDIHGKVVDPQVLKTNNALFAREFLSALQAWRYEPATKDGSAVPSRVALFSSFRH